MTTVTATPGSHELSYERVLQATPDLVYRAYTEADLIRRWWGGNYEMTIDKLEARPGGVWRYVSTSEDGTEFGFHGVFHDLVPGERIVQTFEFEGTPGHVLLETTVLTDQGDGTTKLTGSSVFQTVEDRDGMLASGMESGMNDSLVQLDKVLASL
ncbi:MAG: SRPBCC family protein [Mycobacteriales bacterium]